MKTLFAQAIKQIKLKANSIANKIFQKYPLIKCKIAFSLAETLITLVIIGIVASLTIPAIMQSTQNAELKAQYTKAYSILSQVTMQMSQDIPNLYSYFFYQHAGEFNPLFEQYFCQNGCKRALDSDSAMAIFISQGLAYVSYNRSLIASQWHTGMGGNYSMSNYPNLSVMPAGLNNEPPAFYVDINGYKHKPNRLGVDLFKFVIAPDNRLKPYGYNATTPNDECSAASSLDKNGFGCTYSAYMDKNPDDPSKSYWANLP